MNVQETKNCVNCKFYIQHYIKNKTGFRDVCCGKCDHNYGKKLFKKNKPNFVCEFWEDSLISKRERQESLKKTLWNLSKRLSDIADIIEDDITANKN